MSSHPATMPSLEERPISFDYGYRMNCECGGTSHISAADYHAKSAIDALMPCEHCARTIHFGPAVAALRDPNDPALDDARINQLAWYHTSTTPDWPSLAYATEQRAELLAHAQQFPGLSEGAIERHISQALHVGTYEAAIENMLRRMRDQDDATSQFYLHRVALAVDPDRVEDGYRDENHDEAAQLTTRDLREAGLDAVRYLNVHEHVGSLSLAVLPEAIALAQTMNLPATSATSPHGASLKSLMGQTQEQLDHLQTMAPDTSGIDPIRLRIMQLGLAPDPGGIGAANQRHENQLRELWDRLTEALAQQHLAAICPAVVDAFEEAIGAAHREQPATVQGSADFYAANAAALTRPAAVTALLAAQQPRAITI